MKIAQIGTGYWGKNHARVWKEMKDDGEIDDVLLVDINEEAVKTLAKNLGVDYITDAKDIPSDFDAVDIVAPTPLHFPLSMEFMEKGMDVLVEKPMTATSEESKKLVEYAEENGRILMPGHLFRYHPALNHVKKMVQRGDFGRIFYMKTVRSALRVPRKDMGVLLALAIHDVDTYSYVLERKADSVLCSAEENIWEGIEDVAHLRMDYGDVTGYIFESWLSPIGNKVREFQITGETMSARIDYLKPDIIEIYESGLSKDGDDFRLQHEGMRTVTIPYREPLKEELRDFVASVKSRKMPVANMHAGMHAVEVIEKATESAKNGRKMGL